MANQNIFLASPVVAASINTSAMNLQTFLELEEVVNDINNAPDDERDTMINNFVNAFMQGRNVFEQFPSRPSQISINRYDAVETLYNQLILAVEATSTLRFQEQAIEIVSALPGGPLSRGEITWTFPQPVPVMEPKTPDAAPNTIDLDELEAKFKFFVLSVQNEGRLFQTSDNRVWAGVWIRPEAFAEPVRISTSGYTSVDDLLEAFHNLMSAKLDIYQSGEFEVTAFTLTFFKNVAEAGGDVIGLGTDFKAQQTKPLISKLPEKIKKDTFIFNPRTNVNCFYQCVEAWRNPHQIGELSTDKRTKLAVTAASLKKTLKNNEQGVNKEQMQKTADHIGANIVVWHMDPREQLTQKDIFISQRAFLPIKTCNLMRTDTLHYWGLLSHYEMSEVQVKRLTELCDKLVANSEKEKRPERLPYFKGKAQNLNKRLYTRENVYIAADFEAFRLTETSPLGKEDEFYPYAFGVCWGESEEQNYKRFLKGQDETPKKFITDALIFMFKEFASVKKGDLKKPIVFMHNGGRFDCLFMLKYADSDKFEFVNEKIVYSNGRFLKLTIACKETGKTLQFQDSFAMLPMGLDKLSKDFKTTHRKLPELIDHTKVNNSNYIDIMENQNGNKYLLHDCFSLHEVLAKHEQIIWDTYKVNALACLSASSLGKNIFRNEEFYSPKNPKEKIVMLDRETQQYIRKAYFGGRQENFILGETKKQYYFDITSLYPYCGTFNLPVGPPCRTDKDIEKRQLPIGPLKNIFKNGIGGKIEWGPLLKGLTDRCVGFVTVTVKTIRRDVPPLHCYKHPVDKVNIYPYFDEHTEMTLPWCEVAYGLQHGINEYILKDTGVWFKGHDLFKKVNKSIFKMKQFATMKNEDTKAFIYKIIINSLYGWTSLKDKGVSINISQTQTFLLRTIKKNTFLDCQVFGDNIFTYYENDTTDAEKQVGIGAYIAAKGRLILHELMMDVTSRGGKLTYCDTDSLVSDYNIEDDPILKEKWMKHNGEEMGELKNEISAAIQKMLIDDETKKQKIFLSEESKKVNYIERFLAVASKCYFWKTPPLTDVNGKELFCLSSKMKGYRQRGGAFTPAEWNQTKVSEKQYEHMINHFGKSKEEWEQHNPLRQTVLSFMSKIRNHKKEPIFMQGVEREVVFAPNYKKGVVGPKINNQMIVTPFSLPLPNPKNPKVGQKRKLQELQN